MVISMSDKFDRRVKERPIRWTKKKQEALEEALKVILIASKSYDTEIEKKAMDWLRVNRAVVLL